jgi:hypothetical protein
MNAPGKDITSIFTAESATGPLNSPDAPCTKMKPRQKALLLNTKKFISLASVLLAPTTVPNNKSTEQSDEKCRFSQLIHPPEK